MFRDNALEQDLTLDGLHPTEASRVFQELSEYLGQPIEQIAEEYWRYRRTEDVAAQAVVAVATDAGPIMAYYQATPHYLYELSYWEASRDKQAWFDVLARACRQLGLQRVLDYGGGVGGSCLALRRRGIACDYVDVQGKTFEYARWRFARHGVAPRMFNILEGWPPVGYQAVTTWDVLEHVFDLDDTIRNFRRVLEPGGYVLSKSTFAEPDGGHLHIHLAKHKPYADVRRLNDLFGQHGFRFIGQLKPSRASRLLRQGGVPHAVVGIAVRPKLKHGGNFLVHQAV